MPTAICRPILPNKVFLVRLLGHGRPSVGCIGGRHLQLGRAVSGVDPRTVSTGIPGGQGDRGRPGVQVPARGARWLARGSGARQGDREPARGSGAGQGASMVLGREIIEMKIYCLRIFLREPHPGLGSVYCILIVLDDFSLRFNDFDKYAVTKR